MVACPPINEVRRSGSFLRPAERQILLPDTYEPLRVSERQSAKQHGINDAENSRVRADSEGECNDCRSCKARCLSKPADAVAEISPNMLERNACSDPAHLLFDLLYATKLDQRRTSCFVRLHTGFDLFRLARLDVLLELIIK